MSVKIEDVDSVTLFPLNVTIQQLLDMVLFTITDYSLVHKKENGGIRMTITLKRKIMSEMMTTYFPSLLLMMITYATTFFKPFFFEAALSVNLTTMLVMTTIFISKMEGLPPTSDIKMIDYWLILCQLVPFVQVVLLTAIEFLKEEAQEDKQGKEGIKLAEPTSDNGKNEEEKTKPKPKKAWNRNGPQIEHSKSSYLKMLLMIGKFLNIICITSKISFQRQR